MSEAETLGLSIPLFNEEASCGRVISDLDDTLAAAGIEHVLLLVDNGSTDATPSIVDRLAEERPTCRPLHLPENAGYGGGILAGLRALDTPILGWHWGDGQVAPEVVAAAWRLLVEGGYDLVKTRRIERQDGLQRRIVSTIYNGVMTGLFASPVRDVNGCPKLMRREIYERLAPSSTDWFLDPEVVLSAAEAGLPWGELTCVMRPREGGASNVSGHTLAEFLRHLWQWKRGWRPK